MDNCDHTWLYIGSKRQKLWRCALCDEHRLDDPAQKREWQGLTDEELDTCIANNIKIEDPALTDAVYGVALEVASMLEGKNA